jgi:hypothetical protein
MARGGGEGNGQKIGRQASTGRERGSEDKESDAPERMRRRGTEGAMEMCAQWSSARRGCEENATGGGGPKDWRAGPGGYPGLGEGWLILGGSAISD